MNKIAWMRENYSKDALLEENLVENPFVFFENWFNNAVDAGIKEPNAMIVSTISDNKPHARVVLLKGVEQNGFVFYTNYGSHKGQQLAENPNACITFFWDLLERQVRIEGTIKKVSAETSDAYFSTRPRGSQIGAWVSEQSSVISDRNYLENKLTEFETKFEQIEVIPRPEHWGGYVLEPVSIEFWQGRQNRLHDRILYSKTENNWSFKRLSP